MKGKNSCMTFFSFFFSSFSFWEATKEDRVLSNPPVHRVTMQRGTFTGLGQKELWARKQFQRAPRLVLSSWLHRPSA